MFWIAVPMFLLYDNYFTLCEYILVKTIQFLLILSKQNKYFISRPPPTFFFFFAFVKKKKKIFIKHLIQDSSKG